MVEIIGNAISLGILWAVLAIGAGMAGLTAACVIIDLGLIFGKLNLRRCDSGAVKQHYFSSLKCLLG